MGKVEDSQLEMSAFSLLLWKSGALKFSDV